MKMPFRVCFFDLSVFCRGELDDEIHIVGLDLCLVRRLVSDDLAAPLASVYDDEAFFRIGLGTYRTQDAAAGVCSVAGVNIYVQRAEAEWTMIS